MPRLRKIRPSPVARASPRSLTEHAVSTIRDRILDMTLAPGSRMDETLLMEQFQLSRTPAREALNRLAAEGLVVLQANRGAYVRQLDFDNLRALFDVYFVEERMIGHFCNFNDATLVADLERIHREHQGAIREGRYLDVTRLNSEFHLRIAKSSANEYVIEFGWRIHNHFRRLAHFIYVRESQTGKVLADQMKKIVGEHARIIGAIRRRDQRALTEVLVRHAKRAQTRLLALFSQTRGDAFPLED